MTKKQANDPGHKPRQTLKAMDLWVNSIYLLTPLLLGLAGGVKMIGLVLFIYPLISLGYFVVRHRYLKNLPREQHKGLVPYSYLYTGRSISMVILIMTAGSCAWALFNFVATK